MVHSFRAEFPISFNYEDPFKMSNNSVEPHKTIWPFNEHSDDWENVMTKSSYGFSNSFKWMYNELISVVDCRSISVQRLNLLVECSVTLTLDLIEVTCLAKRTSKNLTQAVTGSVLAHWGLASCTPGVIMWGSWSSLLEDERVSGKREKPSCPSWAIRPVTSWPASWL